MPGIDAQRKPLHAQRPDCLGITGVLDGELALHPAAGASQKAPVGAGVRAAFISLRPEDIGEKEQQQSPKSDFATQPELAAALHAT